jgi:predicted esterase
MSDLSKDPAKTHLQVSYTCLHAALDAEAKELNDDYSKIFVAGKSQGAKMAWGLSFRTTKALGGVFQFAGMLPPSFAQYVMQN